MGVEVTSRSWYRLFGHVHIHFEATQANVRLSVLRRTNTKYVGIGIIVFFERI
jgi:hypothetical protein